MSKPGNFISNFEPLDRQKVGEIVEEVIGFEQFTEPMQERLSSFMDQSFPKHVVSSAHPRIVDGTHSQKDSIIATFVTKCTRALTFECGSWVFQASPPQTHATFRTLRRSPTLVPSILARCTRIYKHKHTHAYTHTHYTKKKTGGHAACAGRASGRGHPHADHGRALWSAKQPCERRRQGARACLPQPAALLPAP